jgi:hypothetical protein
MDTYLIESGVEILREGEFYGLMYIGRSEIPEEHSMTSAANAQG